MSIVLVIGCCIAIVLAIILFSYGRKKEKPALTTTGFVVAIMLAAIMTLSVLMPTKVSTYEVVYAGESTLTIMDEETGRTKVVNLDDTAHTGSFTKNGHAYVVEGGILQDIKYIAPQ